MMPSSTTQHIVSALTQSIVTHELRPGTKLAEQKLADHFEVSRTLVRQALYQLERDKLVRIEPARGAFVASPSVQEAQQVFAVRAMLEQQMVREFCKTANRKQVAQLRQHIEQEQLAISEGDAPGRIELLGDFHVRMAELLGNEVLAELLTDLISRCSLITLMYQTVEAAQDSHHEHVQIVDAIERRDGQTAAMLMAEHLQNVQKAFAYVQLKTLRVKKSLAGVLH